MAKNEMGGKLLGALSKTVETVKTTTTEKIAPEVAKAAKKAADGIKEADIPGNIKKTTQGIQGQVKAKREEKKAAAEQKKKEEEKKNLEPPVIVAISPVNAVKIFYYLMSVDGEISPGEEEKFNLIAAEIDSEFEEHKDDIIKICKEQLDKTIDDESYYDVVQDAVENALVCKQDFEKGYVPVRLLIWDLLTLAYSDDNYDDDERKLLKYIVRKVDIPKDIFLEMENSLLTVDDLEKELKWIKTTDRPYLKIEEQVKEIERREQAIYESVKALIVL